MLLDTELAAIGVESYIRNWAAINHTNSQTVECCCLAARIGVTQPNHKTALADRPTDRPPPHACQQRFASGAAAHVPSASVHWPTLRVQNARARALLFAFPPKRQEKCASARAFYGPVSVSSLSSGGAQIKLCHHTTHAHTHHHRRKCAPPRFASGAPGRKPCALAQNASRQRNSRPWWCTVSRNRAATTNAEQMRLLCFVILARSLTRGGRVRVRIVVMHCLQIVFRCGNVCDVDDDDDAATV